MWDEKKQRQDKPKICLNLLRFSLELKLANSNIYDTANAIGF